MRLTMLAACAALSMALLPLGMPARAANEDMRAMIAQLRETAARMKGQLPQSEIDEMLQQANELEQANGDGAFTVAARAEDPNDIIVHMSQVHGARFEWLIRETACAGYQWETWRVYHLDTGDRDAERDKLCKRAYALYEEYFYLARDGKKAQADPRLAAFDKAAHEAVDFYERR